MVFKTVPPFLLHTFLMIFQDGQTLYQLLISCLIFHLMFINWHLFLLGKIRNDMFKVPESQKGKLQCQYKISVYIY